MTQTFRLVAVEGTLYFPKGGLDATFSTDPDAPSLLIQAYPAGDMDTVPWPLESKYATLPELRKRLASALYGERETNDCFPSNATIELPDGTPFDFDVELGSV